MGVEIKNEIVFDEIDEARRDAIEALRKYLKLKSKRNAMIMISDTIIDEGEPVTAPTLFILAGYSREELIRYLNMTVEK